MIILVIPIAFALVTGLLCMGPFGWIMLALGLEFFGWVTAPRQRRARIEAPPASPASIFILSALVLAIFVLVFVQVAQALNIHFSLP